MTDDDTDLLEHQATLKSNILQEKASGTTYINPSTGRPFPKKHWELRTFDPSHRQRFDEALERFSQNKKSKSEIQDQIDASSFDDKFLTEELSHAIQHCHSTTASDHNEAISVFRALADNNPIAAYHLGLQLQVSRSIITLNQETKEDPINPNVVEMMAS